MPPDNAIDWVAVRATFPACREHAYLNTASYGPGPAQSLEAVQTSLVDWAGGRGDWRLWEAAGERARALAAQLLRTEPANVALFATVSAAASQVAAGLVARRAAGSAAPHAPNIVVGASEFRSNLFAWLALEAHGFEVRQVLSRGGAPRTDDLVAALDDETVLLAVSAVQSATGHRADLAELRRATRAVGAELFVDGTQAVGALALDAHDTDYLAVAGYKWLLAPRGTAYLFVAPEHHARIPPNAPGWKTPAEPHADYYGGPYQPAQDATRFDHSLAWPSWVGAVPGLELILELGIEAIEERNRGVAELFCAHLPELGLAPLFGPRERSQIVALELPDPAAAAERLAAAGVSAAVRNRYLRVAFHFFNDESDVERALAALGSTGRS